MDLSMDIHIHGNPGYHTSAPPSSHWRNDGVAAASRDGGPSDKGGPDSFIVLND